MNRKSIIGKHQLNEFIHLGVKQCVLGLWLCW